MAIGKINLGATLLWQGSTQSGTITLNDSIYNYDLLIFTLKTNVDLFTHLISPKGWTISNNNSCTYLLQNCANVNSTAWDYRSQTGVKPIADNQLSISNSSNNSNWTAKVICVEGLKLS